MNGALDYWQRGVSFPSILSNRYFADRFIYLKSGSMAHTISRDTDVPTFTDAGFIFPYSILATVTAGSASLAASDFCGIEQRIEGAIASRLYGRDINVSFWVKSSVTGTNSISIRNNDNSRSYVTTYTINAANTWEKKTIKLSMDLVGLWLYDTGAGIKLFFNLGSGSTYQAPSTGWGFGNYLATSSCINAVASAGITFRITGIQLEEGSEPSTFDRYAGNIVDELTTCQRYYEKTYDIDTTPGTATYIGRKVLGVNDSLQLPSIDFKVAKRAVPTIVFYASNTATAGTIRRYSGSGNISVTQSYAETNRFSTGFPITTGLVSNATYDFHYTVEAEL